MPAKGVTRSSRAKPTINKNAHVTTREIDCQTDDLDQALASDVGKLDALKKTFDSVAISSRNPNVLLYQQRTSLRIIEKLSTDNRKAKQENEKIVTFMGEIFRLVRAMRSEYDSTFVNVQDDFKSMRFDWGRYMAEVTEHFVKQKKSIEDEKKRFKNVMKKKDLHIEDLQSRLNSASEQVKVTVQALEAQQRRVTIAQRDVYAAHEEVKDVNRKLNDQLYLASHQKCRSCQANEKVREMLSNEIAEKTAIIDSMRDKCVEMDGMLQQQKRVNEILSRSVDKHAFSEKAIRGEFDRIKLENESLLAQIKTLKAAKKADVAAAAASNVVSATTSTAVNTAQNAPASITPPDSSSSSDKSAKDEPGNDSQHGSLRSTPNACASNSPLNIIPDKSKPPSAVKTPLANQSPHPTANCLSPSPALLNNAVECPLKVDNNSSNVLPITKDMLPTPPKKKLKKKQQLFNSNKMVRAMPMGNKQRQAHQEELEEGELNEFNRLQQVQIPFKIAQKRMGEGSIPNMALAKKKKSLAIKQKLALQRKLDGQEPIFRARNGPVNNKTSRFIEPRDARFHNDYEWDDRSLVAEEKRQHDARMRDLHSREIRRKSMERDLPPKNLPWQQQPDRQMPPFRNQRDRNVSPQDLDFCERGSLCPAPPIAPQLGPPSNQMRGFQRCDGATLDDVIKRDNMMARRRQMDGPHQGQRIEGQHHQSQHTHPQQRMSPAPVPQRFEPPMENRVPRTSSGNHYSRSFEESPLPDIRSQLGMFPSNSRAQNSIPPPPTFMRPPPESPIQRDNRMMVSNNSGPPLQWSSVNVGNNGPQQQSGGGGSWGGILGPYLQDGPPRPHHHQQPQPQQHHPSQQQNSWLPNGQNFWRH